jgi:hypothetical protein
VTGWGARTADARAPGGSRALWGAPGPVRVPREGRGASPNAARPSGIEDATTARLFRAYDRRAAPLRCRGRGAGVPQRRTPLRRADGRSGRLPRAYRTRGPAQALRQRALAV